MTWPRGNTTASASTPTGSTSTSPSAPATDQIAIAPGYLQKEWVENGRRYFHYKMDAPILNIYSIQSARYAVRRDHWNDVNLEIYYQPGHEFNLDDHDAEHEGDAGLLHRELQPLPVPSASHHRVSGLWDLCRVVRQHHSLLRGHRLHHQGQQQARRGRPSLLCDRA